MFSPAGAVKAKYVFVSLLMVLVFFSGCFSTKKSSIKRPLVETKAEILVSKMDSARLRWNWASLKLSAASESQGNENSFMVSLRMRKDSLIWVSITSLGIEAFRILITRDSLKVLDRLNFTYKLSSFSYLNNTFQLAVDFPMLQGLLLGTYFSYLDDSKLRSSYVEEDMYILSTLRRRKLKRSMEAREPNKRIIQDVWLDPKSFKITKISVDDNKLNKKLFGVYDDFQEIDMGDSITGVEFPMRSTFILESNKPVKFSYDVTKVQFNREQEFPFSIPEKYEPMK